MKRTANALAAWTGVGLMSVGCAPAQVFVVADTMEEIEFTSLELDVDRVVLDGCNGRSKTFVVDRTLDLVDPTGIELPRGEWCGLSLRTAESRQGDPPLRMEGWLGQGDVYHLHASPAEGRIDDRFELRKGKQAILLDVDQWLDLTQLLFDVRNATEVYPGTDEPLITEPATSALLASVELSSALRVVPKKKLNPSLQKLLEQGGSSDTPRWEDDGPGSSSSSGCNGKGCSDRGDTGGTKSSDSGDSPEDSGNGGLDSGISEKSCGDGCGDGDGCAGGDDTGVDAVDTGLVIPGVLGLFALARRRRREFRRS